MSKIYEALLRAELDRLAYEEPIQELHGPAQEYAGEVDPSAVDLQMVPSSVSPAVEKEQAPPIVSGGSTGIRGMRKTRWNPNLDWLPALQQRGFLLEQFRTLRSRFLEMRHSYPIKSILIGSALPQEGKSFVAVNLALSLALHKNSKVLLIDGDMRRHTLDSTLGCELGAGLAEYLSGKASLLDVMQQALPDVAMPNHPLSRLEALTFISAGSAGDSAADLSANKRLPELFATAASHFDWIVVDSSPVNLVSDALNLAHACDGVVLVARSNVTQLPMARHALAEFNQEKVLGFVLNGATDVSRVGGYYGYDTPETKAAAYDPRP